MYLENLHLSSYGKSGRIRFLTFLLMPAVIMNVFPCLHPMFSSWFRPLHKVPEIFSVVAWISSLLFFWKQKCSLEAKNLVIRNLRKQSSSYFCTRVNVWTPPPSSPSKKTKKEKIPTAKNGAFFESVSLFRI